MAALRDEAERRKGEIWEQVAERDCGGRAERGMGGDGVREAEAAQWRAGTIEFQGVGGPWMASEGLNSLFPMTDLSTMGFAEIIPRIPLLWYRLRQAVRHVERFQPHIIVTIDSKGFNFRLLKAIGAEYKRHGRDEEAPFCVHYVAPSFWAFKGGEKRLQHLSPLIDHLLCILPDEPATCQQHGISATYVGHPSLEAIAEEQKDRQSEGGETCFETSQQQQHGIPATPVGHPPLEVMAEERRSRQSVGGEASEGAVQREAGKRREEGGMEEEEKQREPHSTGVDQPWWKATGDGTSFRRQHGIPVGPQHIAICLLPGSRLQEVSRMLPIFIQTVDSLTKSRWLRDHLDSQGPDGTLSLVIPTLPRSSNVTARVESIFHSWLDSLRNKRPSKKFPFSLLPPLPSNTVVDIAAAVVVPALEVNASVNSRMRMIKPGPDADTFAACDLALCVSGSVVVEVLRSQLPLVVTYKANWFSQFIVKQRASIQYASLPNILLNKPLLTEVLFSECTPHNLSSNIRFLMENLDKCKARQTATAHLFYNVLQEPLNSNVSHAPDSELAHTPSKIAAQVIFTQFNS
ncbi:hypothetical protein CLOM_g18749 [Closterium sp. NIES-68]|nr:hypothetical protein CLOM_g18749 [Closterium sp. NIES-68]